MKEPRRYRKRPVVIEAIQWLGGNLVDVQRFCPSLVVDNHAYIVDQVLIIPTLEGPHYCALGDFIIKGVAGEFYACKHDIFAQTYEEVVE